MTVLEPSATPLSISLLGPFSLQVNGAPLPRLRSHRLETILALLTLRHDRPLDRTWLAGLLWPESAESLGLATLRRYLTDLRQVLGPEARRLHSPTASSLVFDLVGTTVDLITFDTAMARGDPPSLQEAVALYRGPLLEGWTEEWVFEERQAREQAFLSALMKLAAAARACGDLEGAEGYLRRAVAADPLREGAQRALMELLADGGSYAAALHAYRELRLQLHRELNAEPDPETAALFQQIRAEARERVVPGARCSVRGEDDGSSHAEPLAPTLTAHHAASSEHGSAATTLEPVGGAVPLDSPFYVSRPPDEEFRSAIARQDSIVLVKGARQTGKTSLLARGLQQAREAGAAVVLTDFLKLNTAHLASAETFFLTLAQWIAGQLGLDVPPDESWRAGCGSNLHFELYLRREVLGKVAAPIVWALDDVDRLFTCDFGSDVFGLLRSWHNARSFHPTGPWSRLTLVIAYATEAHLFLTDPNQSPFNVGTRLTLEDFSVEQVADLNRRYGSPLKDGAEIARLYRLLSGHPYLVRRSLHEMAARGADIAAIEQQADQDEGIFGQHLRRMLTLLARDADLCDVVRGVLQGRPCPTVESFYRLRSAGVMVGGSARDVRPRCQLYSSFLERHLR